jgi:hypothetical protein
MSPTRASSSIFRHWESIQSEPEEIDRRSVRRSVSRVDDKCEPFFQKFRTNPKQFAV